MYIKKKFCNSGGPNGMAQNKLSLQNLHKMNSVCETGHFWSNTPFLSYRLGANSIGIIKSRYLKGNNTEDRSPSCVCKLSLFASDFLNYSL